MGARVGAQAANIATPRRLLSPCALHLLSPSAHPLLSLWPRHSQTTGSYSKKNGFIVGGGDILGTVHFADENPDFKTFAYTALQVSQSFS